MSQATGGGDTVFFFNTLFLFSVYCFVVLRTLWFSKRVAYSGFGMICMYESYVAYRTFLHFSKFENRKYGEGIYILLLTMTTIFSFSF